MRMPESDFNSKETASIQPISPEPHVSSKLTDILSRRMSRRSFVRSAGGAVVGGTMLAACGSGVKVQTEATSIPAVDIAPTATPEPTPVPEKEPVTLREWADKAGIEVGTDMGNRHVPGLNALRFREFNSATVSYDLAWNNLEEERGVVKYSNPAKFADADLAVHLAESNKMSVHGQSLIFTEQYPAWFKSLPKTEMIEAVKKHVTEVVSHFRGKVKSWVVVNEFIPVSWGRDDVLQRVVGIEAVDIAFQVAREADPSAILIYNGNANHLRRGSNQDAAAYPVTKNIVDRLKTKGLINGVGLEMHLSGANPPPRDELIATMQSYGIPVYITEMDVNMKDLPGSQEERFSRQAEIYKDVVRAALDSEVCKSISFYTIGDKYSWIETNRAYQQHSIDADPTMFDDNLQPKPAYFAVLEAIKAVTPQ